MTIFVIMIQRSVKSRSIAGPARLVPPSGSTSTRNAKHVWRSFIPDVAAIETDSRLSNHALMLVLGVSPGYDIVNKSLSLFSCFFFSLQTSSFSFVQQYATIISFVHIYNFHFYISLYVVTFRFIKGC